MISPPKVSERRNVYRKFAINYKSPNGGEIIVVRYRSAGAFVGTFSLCYKHNNPLAYYWFVEII